MTVLKAMLAFLAGLIGGAIFFELHIPLPWMLGSLTATALLSVLEADWSMPSSSRIFAVPIVGVLAGAAFTPAIVQSMIQWWTVIPFLVFYLVFVICIGHFFFSRLCGFDAVTAFFASTPAGLAELTPLAAQFGGKVRALVLIHSIRILAVAFVVPFVVLLFIEHPADLARPPQLATATGLSVEDWLILISCAAGGYLVGRLFQKIGGLLLGPLILSALAHATGVTELTPPVWLVALMQVVIGSVTGARFAGLRWREAGLTVLQGLAWAACLLLMAGAMAALSVTFVKSPQLALMLAFAPGGMAEITIITYSIGIEVAFVVMCHVFRAISVLLFAPIAFQLLQRRRPPLRWATRRD